MTFGIAATISCVLLPLFGWLGMILTRRTIYRPVTSEEGVQRDEQAERDKVKQIRVDGVTRVFKIYGAIVLLLFAVAWLSEPAQKVHAALWPTATPTVTNTPTPTATRPPTNTPTPSRTPSPTLVGDSGSNNFLTSIAGGGTPFKTSTPFLPSGGGSSSVTIIRTVIVPQTQIVQVPVTVIVPQTVIVVVTATNTPLPSPTPESPTQTVTATVTPSATSTPTETPTP